MAVKVNLRPTTRGDSFDMPLEFTDDDNNPIDITTWKLYFTLRKCIPESTITDDIDSDVVLKKDVTVHTDPVNGKSKISLTAEEMNTLELRKYYYDIQAKIAGNQIITLFKGYFPVEWDSTRRTD